MNAILQGYRKLARTRPAVSDDWFLILEHKAIIARHLSAALAEIHGTANDFVSVEVDQYMVDVRASFDPYLETAVIQDAFTDAFHKAECAVKDAGGEPVYAKKTMPSGVTIPTRE